MDLSFAQTSVTTHDANQSTLTAYVSEHAAVSVPRGATFNVTNARETTATRSEDISVTKILLGQASKQLKISLRANAPSFTPPADREPTWTAGDITWTLTSGPSRSARVGGALSDTAYTVVASCAADEAACNTNGLVFRLAPKNTVKRTANHTLAITVKFESIDM